MGVGVLRVALFRDETHPRDVWHELVSFTECRPPDLGLADGTLRGHFVGRI